MAPDPASKMSRQNPLLRETATENKRSVRETACFTARQIRDLGVKMWKLWCNSINSSNLLFPNFFFLSRFSIASSRGPSLLQNSDRHLSTFTPEIYGCCKARCGLQQAVPLNVSMLFASHLWRARSSRHCTRLSIFSALTTGKPSHEWL